jgi:hypothetical protein
LHTTATASEPLRLLTKKNTKWVWNDEQSKAFVKIKQDLSVDCMAYFDRNKRSEITVDASPEGLALIFAQYTHGDPSSRKIIKYDSRALTDVEKRYSQVEREGLAVVWACEKLHLYLYASEFDVVTDNKAVELIFNNKHSKPKARIERWRLRLLPYKFKVVHKRGLENIADYISRNPLANSVSKHDENSNERYIHFISELSRPSAISRDEIIQETAKDKQLIEIIKMIKNENHAADNIYKILRNDRTLTADGIILKANSIILPTSLHNRVVKLAHAGHQGICKTKHLKK